MSVFVALVLYYNIVRTNEVISMSEDFDVQGKKAENTKDKNNNYKKGLTDEERKELYEKISEIEDYDPTEEEVDKMYSDEFNKKWDNFTVG